MGLHLTVTYSRSREQWMLTVSVFVHQLLLTYIHNLPRQSLLETLVLTCRCATWHACSIAEELINEARFQ